MYHVFALLALMAGQSQIDQAKKYTNNLKASHPPINQEIGSSHPKPSEDVLEQFKKELAKEDDAIKKISKEDLESFGVDAADQTSGSDWDESLTKVAASDDGDFLGVVNKNKDNVPVAKSEVKVETKIQPKIENSPPILAQNTPAAALPTVNPAENNSALVAAVDKKDDQPKAAITPSPDNVLIPKTEVVDNNSIKEAQEKLKKATGIDPAKKSKNIAENSIDTSENQEGKIKTKEEKLQEKRRAADDRREKRKLAKLNELREKYLVDFRQISEQENFEINGYENKIIPQKKAEPKIINVGVPVQLLARVKSQDNKYLPPFLTYQERLKFMFKAIAEGRIDDFDAMYYTVKEPNAKNPAGDTLLTYAVIMQKPEAVASLLSKGANPNLPNALFYTPMNLAIELGDYKSALLLAKMGVDINFVDALGRTYLMQAARVGSLPIVDLLVSKGVNINLEDKNGLNALAAARSSNHEVIAKFLLKNGARISTPETHAEKKKSLIEELNRRWN